MSLWLEMEVGENVLKAANAGGVCTRYLKAESTDTSVAAPISFQKIVMN